MTNNQTGHIIRITRIRYGFLRFLLVIRSYSIFIWISIKFRKNVHSYTIYLYVSQNYAEYTDGAMMLEEDGQVRQIDHGWSEIFLMKTPVHEIHFPLLAKMMAPLLSLPHSNADVERLFSILRKIHTDARHSLNADTIAAYIQCKLNIDNPCHQLAVSAEMLRLAKSATHAESQ